MLLLTSTTSTANAQQGWSFSKLRETITCLIGGGGSDCFGGNDCDVGGGSGSTTCEYDSSNPLDDSCSLSSLQATGEERFSVFPGGITRCGRDTKCNGDPNPYFFQVDPGRNGNENNIVIAFQGGGSFLGFGISDSGGRDSPELQKDGIFDLNNPQNPVQDWTRVVITYCTGDLHVGNGLDVNPDDGTEYRFNGRNNVLTVLDWIRANIPNPDRVYLYGSSAGSSGVQLWSDAILSDYKSRPNPPKMSLTADSGNGLTRDNPSSDQIATDLWQICSSELGLTDSEVSLCEQGLFPLNAFQLKAQANHRDVPFSFVNFKFDPILYQNYCEGGTSSSCISESEFYDLTEDFLKGYVAEEEENNVLFYWITFEGHVAVKTDGFYLVVEGGVPLRDFIENLVNYETGQVLQSHCQDTHVPDSFPYDASCDPELLDASFIAR